MYNLAHSGSHEEPARHYYDLVSQRDAHVPESVVSHVRGCSFCRRQVARLTNALARVQGRADGGRPGGDHETIRLLDSHFQSLAEPVTCSRVRPFLPGLLKPSPTLRIPTPITVHVDQCPACARDLDALRELGLDAGQLERLQQLYQKIVDARPAAGTKIEMRDSTPQERGDQQTRATRDDKSQTVPAGAKTAFRSLGFRISPLGWLRGAGRICRRARSAIPAFVRGSFDRLDDRTLSHLSACPRCRAALHAYRQTLLDKGLPAQAGGSGARCDALRAADLFDYAAPHAETTRGAGGVAAHVSTCRRCLEKVQAIHRTIYGVAERPDAGVATVYTTLVDAETVAAAPGNQYADYPIRVEVIHPEPQPALASQAEPKRIAFDPRIRFMLKTAVAAAAIIPLAILFFSTQPASGITLGQVVRAFERAKNVHVTQFHMNSGDIAGELWVSRELNLLVVAGGEILNIYDLARRQKEFTDPVYLWRGVAALSREEYANAQKLMDNCLGFAATDIPSDAAWDHVRTDDAEDVAIYQLVITERTYFNTVSFRKYEIAVQSSTRLPKMVTLLRRDGTETEWERTAVRVFTYFTTDEMKCAIGAARARGTGRP